ncbi:hypothetical protein Hanom_Chr03g00208721 [Helianthus anomalus]
MNKILRNNGFKGVTVKYVGWVGQSLPFDWLAWLRIQGVPLHLASNLVFDSIAANFGKVVQPFSNAGRRGFVIVGEASLSWQDKLYRVWITEDSGSWIPDCLDDVEESEDYSLCEDDELSVSTEKNED